jgi:hypothetical protein
MSGPPLNQPFSEQIYTYYNQYCASPAVTQQRRIMRNYLSNNQVIKQYNQNPFLANPNRQYYFQGNKMFIKIRNDVIKFIKTGSVWCYNTKTALKPGQTINDYLCLEILL